MAVNVYFENGMGAEHIATFKDEETYIACLPALKQMANELYRTFVTESITDKELIEST